MDQQAFASAILVTKGPGDGGNRPGLWPTSWSRHGRYYLRTDGSSMTARLNHEDAAAVMRAANLEPLVQYPGVHSPWLCRCAVCGEDVTPRFAHVRTGHGCRVCGSRKSSDTRRMDSVAAEKFMVSRGFQPLEPYRSSDSPWRCQCLTCGAEVSPCYVQVRNRGTGCVACKYKALAAQQRLPEAEAVAQMRTAGVEPLVPFPGTMFPWLGECLRCEQQVTPWLGAVRAGQGACRFCAGQVVDPEAAAEFMRLQGVNPLVEYPGSGNPWRCECLKCGKVVTPRYSGVRFGQGPCKHCRPYGFDPENLGIVYLLLHPILGAAKVGIAKAAGFRLRAHAKRGWQVVASVEVPGKLAVEIEASILDWWRTGLGLPPYLSKLEMPQSGWTETVDADAIDVPATVRRIQQLASGATSAA